jgi:hypothetical protein
MQSQPDMAFRKCVNIRTSKNGEVRIGCRRGNWVVSGRDRTQVEQEARHYWFMYLQDGEYKNILD